MTPFSYVSVLLAIVVSIAIAHLLNGIARMIWDGVTNFSFPLVQWTAFSFFLCIDLWFYIWSLRDQESWSFGYVSFLIFQASLIYLATHLIVPRESEKTPIDMAAFYERRRRKYMGVCIITAASNELLNLTLPGFGSLHLGLLVTAWAAIFALGWRFSSRWAQNALSVANIVLTAHYTTSFVSAL